MKHLPVHAMLMLLLTIACSNEAGAHEAPRPNVLVILCDDLGYGDLSSFGHPIIRTPNLDLLASQGMRLTDCYAAAPVCSPSRAGLLTGRTPTRVGVYDWIPSGSAMHMSRGEITIPMLLKSAGYETAMAGKWHCNGKFNSADQPQPGDFGFDHWFATQNNAAPSHENPTNFVRNGQQVGKLEGFSCQIVADEAISWLRNRADSNNPFFLYVAFHEPHEPIASPIELTAQYAGVENSNKAMHHANITNMDRAVGKLVKALDDLKLADDTLIYFSSDNGPEILNRYKGAERSYGSPGPLRGMKLWLYEGGVRVPGIVRWPKTIAAGQVVSEPISSVDLLPTLCELAGVAPPSDRALDGTSLVPMFQGQPVVRSTPLYWHYYHSLGEPVAAMRVGDWMVIGKPAAKVMHGKPPARMIDSVRQPLVAFELYNLREDLGEQNDLATQQSQRTAELSRQLIEKHWQVVSSGPDWAP